REAYAAVLREGRKFGIAVITVLQDPYSAGGFIMNNSPRTVVLRLRDEANVAFVARNLATATGVPAGRLRKALTNLRDGEAVVRVGEEVYLVKVRRSY
ncbi:MAG: ATP-binding protein, partial [Desulfurococcales archaeon]|nr:ATP-binding protein [Desulfurococcales archaeon]